MTNEQDTMNANETRAASMLELRDVAMYFKSRGRGFRTTTVKALDGVSLSLDRGETIAIVGESGSGKTTLVRVSLRLLEPTAGRVFFDNEDITRLKDGQLKKFRRRAQGIFQDPFTSLDPYMTIRQIVEEPLVIHGEGSPSERLERVEWALDEVRMRPAADFLDRFPHLLSGGQRQRVGIARSLVLTPDYMLADEPVSMIDASSRAGNIVPAERTPGAARHRLSLHHARHRDGAALRAGGGSHVPGAHRGAGPNDSANQQPAPPLHPGTPERRAGA